MSSSISYHLTFHGRCLVDSAAGRLASLATSELQDLCIHFPRALCHTRIRCWSGLLHTGAGDLSTGPRAFMANILLTEPSPQPPASACFLRVLRKKPFLHICVFSIKTHWNPALVTSPVTPYSPWIAACLLFPISVSMNNCGVVQLANDTWKSESDFYVDRTRLRL